MQRSASNRFFAYAMILTLVGSLFSLILPAIPKSYASHENITVEISGDEVTETYGESDDVAITGVIDEVVDNEDVIIRVGEPGDTSPDQVESEEPTSGGNFDYLYEVPSNPEEGFYTVEVEYDDEFSYTYFIVDDEDDTITLALDQTDGIYEAGDDVTIAGQVDNEDIGEEEFVTVIVYDPTNDDIVNEDEVELGAGSLPNDEFEHEFSLDNDAGHGRYAVIVTYNIDDQEGSTLFEIEDNDAGSGDDDEDVSEDAITDDSDGDLSAEIPEGTYDQGTIVRITGTIEDYDPDSDEKLSVSITDPDDHEIDEEDDADIDEDGNDGTFEYNYDVVDDADEGLYTITIAYNNDEVVLAFAVEEGSGGGGGSGSDEMTASLNKASYLAGDTLTVTGTVPKVADPEDGEMLSVFIYHPEGQVVLEGGSSKYVEPSSDGSYSASVLIPSDLEEEDNYVVKVSYLGDTVEVTFDITGVSATPSDQITVETDEDEYEVGSTVEISGEVPDAKMVEGQQLLIRVNKPDGNPCRIDPISVPSSGLYSYSVVLGGICGVAGEYEVEVTYGELESNTSFEVIGSSVATFQLEDDEGNTYPIDYELESGSVNSMFVRPNEDKLVITLSAEEDGQLTVVLPREVIDAIEDGEDIEYIVTIEDESGNVETVVVDETDNTDDERTLVIPFEAGADRIEVQGTQVVPEFGAVAAIVMGVAIVGMIVATAKYNKLNFFRQ